MTHRNAPSPDPAAVAAFTTHPSEPAGPRPFVEPRLQFIEPRLTPRGDLREVTAGFCCEFSP
jgi:hypothetical protein